MGCTDVPWYTICTERFSADLGVDEGFGLQRLPARRRRPLPQLLQHEAMVQFIGNRHDEFDDPPP
jgi:hypothetical protein